MKEQITILGVPIDNITKKQASNITEELIKNSKKSCKMVFAPNVEFIMMAQKLLLRFLRPQKDLLLLSLMKKESLQNIEL